MLRAEKPFPLLKTTDDSASYYPWHSEIQPARLAGQVKVLASAPPARQVAKAVLDKALRSNPPAEAWLGTMAWLFTWILPLFTFSMLDNMFGKMAFLRLVKRPEVH
jgi:hypothetical protein